MNQTKEDELDVGVLDFLTRALDPLKPAPSLRERLMGLASGKERFMPFLDRMMSLFDLPQDAANGELHTIDEADAWEDMVPGVRYRDFEGGPGIGEAHGGLVRVAPGASFPPHEHVGDEAMLMLQGEIEDDAGKRYSAGDLIESDSGSQHTLRNVGETEVIYAARVVAVNFLGDDDDDDDDVDLD
ncbi:MAG: cupin domain-containing protein [Nannocystaceae bacterium]|nr:cupin domain-containing protein [Nannocystaceae bacterium]